MGFWQGASLPYTWSTNVVIVVIVVTHCHCQGAPRWQVCQNLFCGLVGGASDTMLGRSNGMAVHSRFIGPLF